MAKIQNTDNIKCWQECGTWINKMWHIYIYTMEYYSTIKRNEIELFVVRWMDLEIVTLSEVSQTERDKYHMKLLICRI